MIVVPLRGRGAPVAMAEVPGTASFRLDLQVPIGVGVEAYWTALESGKSGSTKKSQLETPRTDDQASARPPACRTSCPRPC